jgi:predicted AlkP superfamily pyrophosphatase or phosphodiesterase
MRSIRSILFFASLFIASFLQAQVDYRPKIVIGIVVDQMRYDYLKKFESEYGEGGFKRLMNEGMSFSSMHFNYKPTMTAAGHASIYTGTTPSIHGVIANSWYSREEGDYVYCVKLPTEKGEGLYSPQRMKTTTFADEMKLSLGESSKSFGVSLKDRGAILPAGHMADGAFWFEGDQGGFVSSAYYQQTKQDWVQAFNERDYYQEYLSEGWKLISPSERYQAVADERPFERPFEENEKAIFPYEFKNVYAEKGDDLIKYTPFGNQMLADFTKELVKNEKLGKDSQMDFLSISFSSTDYIGHQFGVGSRELMDTYLRLDRTLAELFAFFDQQFGDDYLVFLTADHGASENRNQLKEKGIPAGYLNRKAIAKSLDEELDQLYGEADWVLSSSNLNIYLNRSIFKNKELDLDRNDVLVAAYHFLKEQAGVLDVFAPELSKGDEYLMSMTANGFFPKESGDLVLIEMSNWNSYPEKGSGHSSPYAYDTHVPFCIMGKGITATQVNSPYVIPDIAPSLCNYLGISLPDGVKNYRPLPFR